MKNLKSTKAITLVALIITIIVLLILAMVSINLLMNGGIIGRANNTVNDYKLAEENEQIQLGYSNYKLAIAVGQQESLSVEGATVTGNGPWTITFGSTEHQYTLTADGKTIEGPNKSNEVATIQTFTFTIREYNGAASYNTYTAEEGMTWQQWVNSEYNLNNEYYIESNRVVSHSLDRAVYTTDFVNPADTIQSTGTEYITGTGWCCFDPGSQVLMADGTTKNIEDVKKGDMVMSLNEDTGKFISQKVKDTIIKHNSDDLVYVYLSNGKRIGMRAYHPLLTTEGYKSLRPELVETIEETGEKAKLLETGDELIGYGENVNVVKIEQRPEVENYDTYNLSVEGFHNYVVDWIVVHNAREPC